MYMNQIDLDLEVNERLDIMNLYTYKITYNILTQTINDILLISFHILCIQWQMLHFHFHTEALLALKELGFK